MTPVSDVFEDIKNYIDITWELTFEEQRKLEGIISRGMAYLDNAADVSLDYSEESQAKALLMDYVRYIRSNAFDEFQVNYLSELLNLQMQTEVPDDTEP